MKPTFAIPYDISEHESVAFQKGGKKLGKFVWKYLKFGYDKILMRTRQQIILDIDYILLTFNFSNGDKSSPFTNERRLLHVSKWHLVC